MSNTNGRKIIQLTVLAAIVCAASYYLAVYISRKHHHNQHVAIQGIADEVDLDAQLCTDGKDDCRKNLEVFDNSWLATGSKNFDTYLQFPEEIWDDQPATN